MDSYTFGASVVPFLHANQTQQFIPIFVRKVFKGVAQKRQIHFLGFDALHFVLCLFTSLLTEHTSAHALRISWYI
jgi:hypothetical protein